MSSPQLWDFHGGIHPAENKHQSTQLPISQGPIPKHLVLPLNQHIGQPANPIVQVGDHVLKGQMVAKAIGAMSAAVHASSSGTVTAIEERSIPHASGLTALCIEIETDGQDTWIEKKPFGEYSDRPPNELLSHIQTSGIAGMGGAGFPSSLKLLKHPEKHIETLIINAAECEPYITADDMIMRERADDVISGIQILAHLVQPDQCLIGIEDNKPQAIDALKAALLRHQEPHHYQNIKIVVIPTKYPSGGEKQLIEILTGKQVPSGTIPADIGIICHNVGTTAAIYRAVEFGEPLISRITTVTGKSVAQPQNVEVLLGTPIRDVLTHCGWHTTKSSRLIIGGPMMGYTVQSDHLPIIKTTNCLLTPTEKELPLPVAQQPCIRCGMCAEVCPARLLPQQLFWFSQSKEWDKAQNHHLMDCIECGACAYVCPSQIPLVQYYRNAKGEIRKEQAEKTKSDRAKQRFEARQARLEAEQAEKEAKRKARAKAAAKAKALKEAQAKEASNEGNDAAATSETTTTSAVDAALARIQAKKATAAKTAPVEETLESLQTQLASAQKRLDKAKQRLADAEEQGLSTVDAFRAGVAKQEDKLSSIQNAIEAKKTKQPQRGDDLGT